MARYFVRQRTWCIVLLEIECQLPYLPRGRENDKLSLLANWSIKTSARISDEVLPQNLLKEPKTVGIHQESGLIDSPVNPAA